MEKTQIAEKSGNRTRDRILSCLREKQGSFVSGEELAARLGISRTAVWKEIEQLRREGYRIHSVTRKGYCLSPENDVLREEGIRRYLKTDRLRLQVFPCISSTNTVLKAMAEEGAEEGLCLVASEQTAGRGRMGRSFYSPAGTGIYLSLLLRPAIAPADATVITACAAVAVAEAIESLAEVRAEIKWVNDIYVEGHKVCGILTEASLDCENGQVNYLVVGIGINTRLPEKGFPEELRSVAGAAFGNARIPELRCRLTAEVLDRLVAYCDHLLEKQWFEEYKKRSLVLGKEISILRPGQDPEPAVALDLDENCALVVRTADGAVRHLNSGEISIRPA